MKTRTAPRESALKFFGKKSATPEIVRLSIIPAPEASSNTRRPNRSTTKAGKIDAANWTTPVEGGKGILIPVSEILAFVILVYASPNVGICNGAWYGHTPLFTKSSSHFY